MTIDTSNSTTTRLGRLDLSGPRTVKMAAVPPGRRVLGQRYALDYQLGTGGMSTVHAATDLLLERSVAIKMIKSEVADSTSFERMRRESTALACVDSPHVVAIHDVGIDDGNLFLVMQHVRGTTVDEEVRRHGVLAARRACRVISEIAKGVVAMHSHGLIHRDLKPSNVMLDRDDRAVLLDLGVACLRRRRAPLTPPGMVTGTPEFMAPEQLSGRVDIRNDLHQLGRMLVFVLTGRDSDHELEAAIASITPPLAMIARRALAPLDVRYQSAEELIGELHLASSVLRAQGTNRTPVAAPPRAPAASPAPVERTSSRRRGAWRFSAALLTSALVAGCAASTSAGAPDASETSDDTIASTYVPVDAYRPVDAFGTCAPRAEARAWGVSASALGILHVPPLPDTNSENPTAIISLPAGILYDAVFSVSATPAAGEGDAHSEAVATTEHLSVWLPGLSLSANTVRARATATDSYGGGGSTSAAGTTIQGLTINGIHYADVDDRTSIVVAEPLTHTPIAAVHLLERTPAPTGQRIEVNAVHVQVFDLAVTPLVNESVDLIIGHAEAEATIPCRNE